MIEISEAIQLSKRSSRSSFGLWISWSVFFLIFQSLTSGVPVLICILLPDLKYNHPNIRIKIPIIFDFKKKEKPRKIIQPKLDIGWNVLVKSKGKQIKVTKNPVRRDAAQDIDSFLVDNTLSAQFSLKESKKPPRNPKILVPRNYWELNKNKFRQFRIRQGKQIPIKNTFIELKNRRLDTFGEIRKITTERLL